MESVTISIEFFMSLTYAQLSAMKVVVERQGIENLVGIYSAFHGCLMLQFKNITIGIESDGYAHS